MTLQREPAAQRRRSKWHDRASSTAEDGEFAQRAVYHPDQEVFDGLHEELRQHREHLAWLESDGHSLNQTASGLREKIEQLDGLKRYERLAVLRSRICWPWPRCWSPSWLSWLVADMVVRIFAVTEPATARRRTNQFRLSWDRPIAGVVHLG